MIQKNKKEKAKQLQKCSCGADHKKLMTLVKKGEGGEKGKNFKRLKMVYA